MIVQCNECSVKLKVDETKIKEEGSKLKCPKCGNVFTVYRSAPEKVQEPQVQEPEAAGRSAAERSEPGRPVAAQPAPPTPKPEAAPPPPPPQPFPPVEEPLADRAAPSPPVEEKQGPAVEKWVLDPKKIVVAHNGEAVLSLVENLLKAEGYEVTAASEGVSAVVAIEKEKPFMAILDVALPSIYGFEICDRFKNREDSSGIKVILIASIYDKTRYKRDPMSLYGADDYIEKHHIQECLVKKVHRLESQSLPLSGQKTVREEETCMPRPEEAPLRQSQAAEMRKDEIKPYSPPPDSKQVEAARRFARIILSDIALYNQGTVEEGIKSGTFAELLAAELREGRDLYNGRVPEDVRRQADYFNEEVEKFIEKKMRTMEMGGQKG
ncbi:MAG: response regulator [Nitrospirota bacterium]